MVAPLDVCVRGDGIVGRALALLLAREGLHVGLHVGATAAPSAASAEARDVRAYALNHASRALLESLRCWPEGEAVTALQRMEVQAEGGGQLAFSAHDVAAPALGWIVDVPELENRLAQAVQFQPRIERLREPAMAVQAPLTLICEGRASHTRAELGVDFDITPYAQHALAARVRCAQPHGQAARQWFAHGDVLAFLPLGGAQGQEVAIVWSVTPERAAHLQQATPEDFCQQLAQACGQPTESLQLISARLSWPLQKAQARQWCGRYPDDASAAATTPRTWVLAGDAAHNVHPLAGQGLNLGLADVAELVRVAQQREPWRPLHDLRLWRRYERARKAGMLALDLGMDSLQLLFAREGEAWQSLRNWGLDSVNRSGPVKHWLARRAMGQPASPFPLGSVPQ